MPIPWTEPETFTLTACGHTLPYQVLVCEAIRHDGDHCPTCNMKFTSEDSDLLAYGPDLRTPEEIAAVEERNKLNAKLRAESVIRNERARLRRAELKAERERIEAETKELVSRRSSEPSARELRMRKRSSITTQ